jgi:hypothetical protein
LLRVVVFDESSARFARRIVRKQRRSASCCEIKSAKESVFLTIVSSLEIVSFWIQTDSFKHVLIFVRFKNRARRKDGRSLGD